MAPRSFYAGAMIRVAGVDACKQGWVAVLVTAGTVRDVVVGEAFAPLVDALGSLDVIAVDIPIGMPTTPPRRADIEARKLVGRRAASIFSTPPRAVVEAATYPEALETSRRRYGRGVSVQSYRLRTKLLDVDRRVRAGADIHEVHPEVSFRAMAGSPLAFSKRSWNGQMQRRKLLAGAGLVIPDELSDAGAVAVDDVLDAAAVAWSAARIAAGTATPIPDPPDRDEHGRAVAIWY